MITKAAQFCAFVAAGWAIVAALRVEGVLAGTPQHVLAAWTLVPVVCAVGLVGCVGRRSVAPVWLLIGSCLSFVAFTGFSVGGFFTWPALGMLAAGTLHAFTGARRRHALSAPLWSLVGATGLGAFFYAVHHVQAAGDPGSSTEAPAVVYMTYVFVGLLSIIGLVAWRRQSGGRHGAA